MPCQRCGKNTILSITGKCSDLFTMVSLIHDKEFGPYYVPDNIGIGGGDYIDFEYCTECGQIQGEFPVYLDEQDP